MGEIKQGRVKISNIVRNCLFWIMCIALLMPNSCKAQSHSTKLTFPPLEERLKQVEAKRNDKPDKYAIIINGDESTLHTRNVYLAYDTLKNVGFMDKNIFIFSYQKNEHTNIQIYAPTFDNIQALFCLLSEVIDDNDLLLIYGTGHGYLKGDISVISIRRICPSCKYPHAECGMSEIEFEYLIKDINPKYYILIFDQCNSGGFGTRLKVRDNFIIICRTTTQETSTCRHFSKALFDAFLDKSSDADNNGKISIEEAFSKSLKVLYESDPDYRKHVYTPFIGGGVDAKTVYLDSVVHNLTDNKEP